MPGGKIVVTYSDKKSQVISKDSRIELLKDYRRINDHIESLAEGLIHYKSFAVGNPLHAVHRIKHPDGTEFYITVTVVDLMPIDKQSWVYDDKEIANSQGGVTHIKGWRLG